MRKHTALSVALVVIKLSTNIMSQSIFSRLFTFSLVLTLAFSITTITSANNADSSVLSGMKKQLEEMQKTVSSLSNEATGSNIKKGSKVMTTTTLKVRKEAGTAGEEIASVESGITGIVEAEPINKDGYTWYMVSYNTNPTISGWSAGSWLKSYTEDDAKSKPRIFSVEDKALTVVVKFTMPTGPSRIIGIVSWGDGSQDIVTDESNTIDGYYSFRHTYQKPGKYKLYISNATNEKVTREVTVQGGNSGVSGDGKQLPVMFESVDVEDKKVTVGVRIMDAMTRAIGTIDWGDGQKQGLRDDELSSAGGYELVSHKYKTAGTYTVTITSYAGIKSTYKITIEGDDEDDDPAVPAIRSVKINDLSVRATFLLPTIGIRFYGDIDWGDGKKQFILDEDAREPSVAGEDLRISKTIEHTYDEEGTYTITATSILGETKTKEVKVKEGR